MALITNNMAPQGVQAPQKKAPADQVKKAVSRIVTAATMALNQNEVEKRIIGLIAQGNTPAEGLANAILSLLQSLESKVQGGFPEPAIAPAATEIMRVLIKMCQSANVLPPKLPKGFEDEVITAIVNHGKQMSQSKPQQPQPQQPQQAQPMQPQAQPPAPPMGR